MTPTVERILNQCKAKGIRLEPAPDGEHLDIHYQEPPPEDLRQMLRAHKAEIIAILTKPSGTLSAALAQKNEEIAVMRRRLASEYYADDGPYQTWGQDVIGCLTAHVDEIRRYLREGGALTLPPCCKGEYLCLIAMRRFDTCLMGSDECGFSMPKC